MSVLTRLLIRLHPRAWRKRYGDEFLLLLDSAPLTTGVVLNVLGAASREWLIRTLTGRVILGPIVAYVAMLIAQWLAVNVPADPIFSVEDGYRLVTPPWPVALGLGQSLVGFAMLFRFVAGVFFTPRRISGWELTGWTVALLLASIGWLWAQLVGNLGTGLEPRPLFTMWSYAATNVTSNLLLLLAASKGMPDPVKTASPYTGSSRPLGLS